MTELAVWCVVIATFVLPALELVAVRSTWLAVGPAIDVDEPSTDCRRFHERALDAWVPSGFEQAGLFVLPEHQKGRLGFAVVLSHPSLPVSITCQRWAQRFGPLRYVRKRTVLRSVIERPPGPPKVILTIDARHTPLPPIRTIDIERHSRVPPRHLLDRHRFRIATSAQEEGVRDGLDGDRSDDGSSESGRVLDEWVLAGWLHPPDGLGRHRPTLRFASRVALWGSLPLWLASTWWALRRSRKQLRSSRVRRSPPQSW